MAILAIIANAMFAQWLIKKVPLSYRAPEWRPAEKAKVAERIKYHAINGCIQDEQG